MPALRVAHFCPEWDYLMIYPGSEEMECCTCSKDPHWTEDDAVRAVERDKSADEPIHPPMLAPF